MTTDRTSLFADGKPVNVGVAKTDYDWIAIIKDHPTIGNTLLMGRGPTVAAALQSLADQLSEAT